MWLHGYMKDRCEGVRSGVCEMEACACVCVCEGVWCVW